MVTEKFRTAERSREILPAVIQGGCPHQALLAHAASNEFPGRESQRLGRAARTPQWRSSSAQGASATAMGCDGVCWHSIVPRRFFFQFFLGGLRRKIFTWAGSPACRECRECLRQACSMADTFLILFVDFG